MKYKLQDLIDIQQFQSLQDMMNEVYSFTTAILDNEGNILTASGWQDICTKFHRVNPESCKKCTISDSYIVDHIHEANPAVGYKCMNGMYDYAFPIIIDGTHYGNFFTGQFFFETPDVNFFKAQAKKYGFDEIEYLKALDNVPVITEERLNNLTLFLKELIQVISSVGLRNLKQSESNIKLAESQALYHDLVETAQDLIWQADAEGKYTYLNPAWEEVFGYKIGEMIGKKFSDFQTKEWANRDVIEFERLLQSNIVRGLETVHLDKNGKEINLIFNAKNVKDENGKIIGTRGTAFDITDRKKAELEIQELNKELELRVAERTQELEDTNKELESFVYSVSHDLKAPLRSIMGFSEIISRRHAPRLNEEGKAYFGYVLEASKNMANLIEDLLRFSRLSKKSVDKEAIELNDILEQVLQNLNQDILVSNAKIVAPDKMLTIYADRSLLGQILSNLISNGIKYHRKGVDPEIVISVDENEETSTIKISDNGQGIPKEHHEKIFNIFQRLHSSEEYPGTGIGLSIVKKAVASLGGEIFVESELNKGSTFSVVIPKILKYF